MNRKSSAEMLQDSMDALRQQIATACEGCRQAPVASWVNTGKKNENGVVLTGLCAGCKESK